MTESSSDDDKKSAPPTVSPTPAQIRKVVDPINDTIRLIIVKYWPVILLVAFLIGVIVLVIAWPDRNIGLISPR